MGAALGGVVGGASGLSVAALALPGVGPIVVAGLLAAGLVGTAGGVIGQALEERLTSGLSREELQFYETQLRRGRSVVIALAADDGEAVAAREAFEESGALTIDAARDWGTGLRETLL